MCIWKYWKKNFKKEIWKGEIGTDEKRIQDIQKSLKMTENPGVYMEVLEKELQKRNMEIPIVTMKEAVQLLNN